jgi:diaminopimelate decarboxylase
MTSENKIRQGIQPLESNDAGELMIGGCNTIDMAKFYGTPLHVVDTEKLQKTARDFAATVDLVYPGKISVHYAFKCNPVPGILRIVREAGLKAEVMSEYELHLALKLGYTGNEIIVNGPFKTDRMIRACIDYQVRLINIDSMQELERVESLCAEENKNTDVLLRVNVDFIPSGMNNGSSAASRSGSPFGLDLKGGEVIAAIDRIKIMKHLTFRGFHLHIGSGLRDTDDYRKAIVKLKQVLDYVECRGLKADIIDIGGGLGIPGSREMTTSELLLYQAFNYLDSNIDFNRNLSFLNYARSLTEGICSLYRDIKLPELIMEPGRCITGPNQVLLLGIHQVKERKGLNKWLVADAGIATLTMPTYYEHHNVILCNDIRRELFEKVTITGPGCFSADVVYKNKLMPQIRSGEIIAILDSGAYFTSWESSFGFPRPAIISSYNGRHTILRARETFEHMVSLDTF